MSSNPLEREVPAHIVGEVSAALLFLLVLLLALLGARLGFGAALTATS